MSHAGGTEAASDRSWNERVRGGETETERADRNFRDLLQELRVTLTGSQILFAFMFVAPFTSPDIKRVALERNVYYATMTLSALAAGLLVSPAAMHRVLFRHHLKADLVRVASTVALGGQTLFVLALAGAIFLVGNYLYGVAAGAAVAVLVVLWCGVLFVVVPLRLRGDSKEAASGPPTGPAAD